jgi:ABC-type phosphate/phosphonate transport system substrate-binding protein
VQRSSPLFNVILGIALLGTTLAAVADSAGKAKPTKVGYTVPARTSDSVTAPIAQLTTDEVFVFSAMPHNNYADAAAIYQPIAEYLARITGKRFVYRHADNWLNFNKEMANGTYDLVFDGAVTNGWRQQRMSHVPLVKLSTDLAFVTVARQDNPKVTTIKHVAGQKVCAHAPTDPEVVALLSEFDNPARQPVIVDTKGWDNAYQALLEGKCAATVIPQKYLEKTDRRLISVLQQHRPMPSYTFSAGPRLSMTLQAKIREALLSGEGKSVTEKLRAVFGDDNWAPANAAEYANLSKLLKDNLYLY